MPRARSTGSPPLIVLPLPGHCRGTLFSQAGRRGGQSPWMAAELSAERQLGKKDLTGTLMVGGLMQTWPKYSRCTELAKGSI